MCVQIQCSLSRIGPKPGRTLQLPQSHGGPKATRRTLSFPRPPSISTSAKVPTRTSNLPHLPKPLASGLRFPVSFLQSRTGLPSLVRDGHTLVSPLDPPPCGLVRGKPLSCTEPMALHPLGPCFCSPCAPPVSSWVPEGPLDSTELASWLAPQGVWCPEGRNLPVRSQPKLSTSQTPNHRSR